MSRLIFVCCTLLASPALKAGEHSFNFVVETSVEYKYIQNNQGIYITSGLGASIDFINHEANDLVFINGIGYTNNNLNLGLELSVPLVNGIASKDYDLLLILELAMPSFII